jgi:hypothetical protein
VHPWSSLDFPFAISSSSDSISLSLDQGTSTASPFIAFGFPNVAIAQMQAFLYDRPALGGKTCPRRETQSACGPAKLETIGTDLGLAYTSATSGTSLETPRFGCAALFCTPHALLCLTEEVVMKMYDAS